MRGVRRRRGGASEGRDVLLALDDFTGLVGFREMARLSPQLEMEDATEEEAVEY